MTGQIQVLLITCNDIKSLNTSQWKWHLSTMM